jgi:hypothetical protein
MGGVDVLSTFDYMSWDASAMGVGSFHSVELDRSLSVRTAIISCRARTWSWLAALCETVWNYLPEILASRTRRILTTLGSSSSKV